MMNFKTYQHPETKEIRPTRDWLTARALKAAGWVEVTPDARIVTKADETRDKKAVKS